MPDSGDEAVSLATLPASHHTHPQPRPSRYSVESRRLSTLADAESLSGPQVGTFDPAQPRPWQTPVAAPIGKLYRQILGSNPFKNTYLSLYDPLETAAERATAVAGALFAVAAGVPLPLIGYIFGQIINEFPPQEDVLRQRLIQLLGVAVAYFGVTTVYTIAFGLTAENVSVKLRRQLLDCLLHLDQAYLDTHDIDVTGLLTEKMDTIQAGCSEKVGIFIQAISYFVAAFIVGFLLDAKLTGILLASVVPAVTLSFVLLSPMASKCSRAVSEQNEQANGIVEGALGAVKVVQAFDMSAKLCRKHFACLERSTHASVMKAVFAALQSASVYFIAYAANALAFYLGSRIASSGNAGTVYAVVFLILDASFVVGQFAPFLEIFARAASARGVIQDLFEASRTGTRATYRRNDNKPDLRAGDVVFQDVTFQYPARPTVNALNELDVTFEAGKFTALVGTSGGGKSTLVALMLGIYDYSGSIKIGPAEIREIDSSHLRSQIAVVDQDTVLLSGTVFENVCHGLAGQHLSDSQKMERCKQALKDANVDFIQHLPHGLDTRLSNELQLSGGQRQRLCLARSLIKQPALLVLDEPTSALDARSEVAVMEAVRKVAASGTTVVMIAHRLSTTLDADHVAVMSDGKVVEQGSPLDLSKEGTVFRSLLDAQKTNMREESPSWEGSTALLLQRTRSSRNKTASPSLPRDEPLEPEPGARSVGLWTVAKRVGSMARPESWIAAVGLLASIVSGGILLGQAIVFGSLIELLNTGRQNPSYYERADFFCLMFFVLALIALAAYGSAGTAFGVTSARLTGRVQAQLFRKLLSLDMQWFSEPGHSTHRLMEAFTKDPGDLAALGGVALGAIFTIFTSITGGIILALVVAWKIAVVLLAAVPVMMFAGYARLWLLTASESRHREAYGEATSLAAEACRSRRAVTALCLEDQLLEEYQLALHEPFRQIRRFVFGANTLLAMCFSITYFVYALAYWWGSQQVRSGMYSVTDFFIVLPALLFSAQSAGQFFSLSPEIARAKTAARSIFTLLNAESNIITSDDTQPDHKMSSKTSSLEVAPVRSPESADGLGPHPRLQLRDVSLVYSGTCQASLSQVNVTIDRGQSVAFVGPSGAGKSSAMALLERFYDPTDGTVLYDGTDVRQMDVRSLRGRMSLVSQDPDLFAGSISYNIKLGGVAGSSVTDDEVERACRRCGLHDFISSLPDGYHSECGTRGSSRLSGGQKQRVAIARALVRNPDVLLLDEPTSALDAHSEAQVQAALAEAQKGRTTVMVAHRLASIQHVDQIFVFDRGRMVAQGTHAELVEQGGLYASMAQAQSLV